MGAILDDTNPETPKAWLIQVTGKNSIKCILGIIKTIWIWIDALWYYEIVHILRFQWFDDVREYIFLETAGLSI